MRNAHRRFVVRGFDPETGDLHDDEDRARTAARQMSEGLEDVQFVDVDGAANDGLWPAKNWARYAAILSAPPANEADHFYTCKRCGQAVDKRLLGDVLYHEQPEHEPLSVRWRLMEPGSDVARGRHVVDRRWVDER